MRIQELLTHVKSLVNYAFFPYAFPTTAADECGIVTIIQGLPEDVETGVKRPNFQVLIRGKARDFNLAEAKAWEVYRALANKKDVRIGAHSVVVIRPQSSTPIFIGLDEAERPVYSLNFETVIRP
jgi:Bacteriophage minor capsid protein